MNTFEPTFSNVEKDIERYLEKYGVHNTINGTPVIRGYDKAQAYILDQYYQHEAFDALVTYFRKWNWELGDNKFLLDLSATLETKKDTERLKRLWYAVLDKRIKLFWQLHALPASPNLPKQKQLVLEALAKVQKLLLELGDDAEVKKLDNYIAQIEREKKRTLPTLSNTLK